MMRTAGQFRQAKLLLAAMWLAVGWIGVHSAPAHALSLDDLPSRLQDAVDRHDEALAEFRIVLVAKQVGSGRTPLCEDPQLLRSIAKCVVQHTNATNAYDEIQSRLSTGGGEVSMENQRALDRASRLIGQLEPLYASSVELAEAGTCDPYRIAINVDQQHTEDEKARKIESSQERADFLDELVNEALSDNRVAPASGSDSEPVTPSSGWDHSRFSKLYSRYLAASTEYKQAAKNFLDRLDLLSAYGEEICHDEVLAYSYSESQRTGVILLRLFEAIFGITHPNVPFRAYPSAISDPDESFSRLPVEDQLAFVEVARDFQNLITVNDFIGAELSSKAEGCDPEELADQGNRTAEEGQDPESGLDAEAEAGTGGEPTGLTANFTGSPTSGDAPLVVHFTDLSSGGEIESWSWTFGDGGSSTAENPSYTFEDEGTWTVSLTVTDTAGLQNTETKSGFIRVGTGPEADFAGSPTSGDAPLTVNFVDQSTGEIDSWSWTFGDGGSSTAENPSYTFEDEGNWTVSLTVSGPDGSDTETKSGYISVGSGGNGDLRYVRTGDPWIQEKTRADCDGGYFEFTNIVDPVFPAEIRPDGNYTVGITLTWTSGGPRWDEFVFAVVLHIPGFNRLSEQITSPLNGSRTIEFTFSGAEVNFNEDHSAMTFQVGGTLGCVGTGGEISSDEFNITFVQQYDLEGSK